MSDIACEQIGPLLSALVDEELDAAERASVDGHLQACGRCRRRLSGLRRSVALMRAQAPTMEPSVAFLDVLSERLRAESIATGAAAPRARLESASLPPPARITPVRLARWVAAAALIAAIVWGAKQIERSITGLQDEIADRNREGVTVGPPKLPEQPKDPVEVPPGGDRPRDIAEGPKVPVDVQKHPNVTGGGYTEPGKQYDLPRPPTPPEPRPQPPEQPTPQPDVTPTPPDPAPRDPAPPAVERRDPPPPPPPPIAPTPRRDPEEMRRETERAIALIVEPKTDPARRADALFTLGNNDVDETYDFLDKVALRGGLEKLPEPHRLRRSAFLALGLLATERAGEMALERGLQPTRSEQGNPAQVRARRVEASLALGQGARRSGALAAWVAARARDLAVEGKRPDVIALLARSLAEAGAPAREAAGPGLREAFLALSEAEQRRRSDELVAARALIARALGAAGDQDCVLALTETLRGRKGAEPESSVREAAAGALGWIGGRDESAKAPGDGAGSREKTVREVAVGALADAMTDDREDQRVREAAALALAYVPAPGAFEALLNAIPDRPLKKIAGGDRALYGCQATAMFLMTGEDFEEPADWRGFWRDHGGPQAIKPLVREPLSRQEYDAAREFFRVPLIGEKVLLLVDVSGSMGQDGKMDLVKGCLEEVIERFKPETRFALWTFTESLKKLTKLAPATDRNKQAALKTIRTTRALFPIESAHTDLVKALRRVVASGEYDAIFLISDGQPTVGSQTDPLALVDELTAVNVSRRTRLNTVGIFRGRDELHLDRGADAGHPISDLMRDLAARNKGLFLRN